MKKIFSLLIVFLLFMGLATPVLAQNEELTLRMSRDFGYSSGTGDIQGLFSIKVSGPDTLARVVFYIDETVIGEDSQAPFRLQFDTDAFPKGTRQIYAVGYLADGTTLQTRVVTVNFVSAEEGWQTVGRIVVPLVVVIVVAVLISAIIPMITGKKAKNLPLGAERTYGVHGGTICPKCNRPFAMGLFAANLLMYRYHRCPFCGKWSLVQRKSIEVLRQAEQDERQQAAGEPFETLSPEEKLKKDLDNSRYQDM